MKVVSWFNFLQGKSNKKNDAAGLFYRSKGFSIELACGPDRAGVARKGAGGRPAPPGRATLGATARQLQAHPATAYYPR
jgi:hypothetical protein